VLAHSRSPYLPSRTKKVAVYAPAERADITPPISSLPLHILCDQKEGVNNLEF
jgi:hypothetical protein